jgi:hypothetical protein
VLIFKHPKSKPTLQVNRMDFEFEFLNILRAKKEHLVMIAMVSNGKTLINL